MGSSTNLSATTFLSINILGATATPTPTVTRTVGPPTITPTQGPVCRDGFEPDGTQSQARLIAVNEPQRRALCPRQDEDWLVFRGVAGKRYQIDMPTVSNGIDPTLELFDAAGRSLAYNDDRSTTPPDLRPLIGPLTIASDGDYYVRVRDVAGGGGVEHLYTIVLVGLGGSSGPPPVITGLPETLSLLENQQASLNFVVAPGGGAAQLEVSIASSDPTLFPPGSVTVSGSGASRTLRIAPSQTNVLLDGGRNRTGTARLTVTVREVGAAQALRASPPPPGATPTAKPTRTPVPQAEGAQTSQAAVLETIVSHEIEVTVLPPPWLAMLYLAGDDIAPEQSAFGGLDGPMRELIFRLNRMPYNPAMRLVVLFDGRQSGDSQVYVREPDRMVNVTESLVSRDPLGGLPRWAIDGFPANRELDTGNPQTLGAFVRWARQAYPTEHTFLSVVNHGGGWAPTYADLPGQPAGRGGAQSGSEAFLRGMAIDMGNGGTALSTRDTRIALEEIGGKLDVLFFDACLMGMIESAYEVRDAARYFVAGQNLLFAWFPYERYLSSGRLSRGTTPRGLALTLVDSYNAGVIAEQNPFTVAAIDLDRLGSSGIATKIGELGRLIGATAASSETLKAHYTELYSQTQKFDEDASLTIDPDEAYIDLGDFLRRLQRPGAPEAVRQLAAETSALLLGDSNPVIVRHRQVSGIYEYNNVSATFTLSDATGLSIYLPLGAKDERPDPPSVGEGQGQSPIVNQAEYYRNGRLPLCDDPNGCFHLTFTLSDAAQGWANWISGTQGLLPQAGVRQPPVPLAPDPELYRYFLPVVDR